MPNTNYDAQHADDEAAGAMEKAVNMLKNFPWQTDCDQTLGRLEYLSLIVYYNKEWRNFSGTIFDIFCCASCKLLGTTITTPSQHWQYRPPSS